MKITKNVAFLIIVVFFLVGCDSNDYVNQKKEANIILEDLISALDKNDSKSIKELFSIQVQDELGEELDKQIEKACEYYEGASIEYDKIDNVSGGEEYDNHKLVFSRISNACCDNIETSDSNYSVSFSAVLLDESDNINEGIWRIWIGKSEYDYMIIGSSDIP